MPNKIAKTAHYYSPSQIATFDLCPRKWGWEYIEGIKTPSTAAQKLGTRVHEVLEKWLGEGEAPDSFTREGKIATAGLGLLPLPSDEVNVEGYFAFALEGLRFRGFKDVRFVDEEGVVVVLDHKTTTDFKWALDEDSLRHNVQALIYAKDEIDRHDLDEVRLRWVYYLTTKNRERARAVEVHLTREEVDSLMADVLHTAQEMEKYRLTVVDGTELPIDPSACGAYGGCPHINRCNLTTRQLRRAILAQEGKKRMKLADRIKQRAAARKKAKEAGEPVGRAEPEINPPEAPSEEEALSSSPEEEPKKTKRAKSKGSKKIKTKGSKKLTKKASAEPTPVESSEEEGTSEASSEEDSPKKRGRPKGSSNVRKFSVVVSDYPTAVVVLNAAALFSGQGEEAFERVDQVLKDLKKRL